MLTQSINLFLSAGSTLLFCIYLLAGITNTAARSKKAPGRLVNVAFVALLYVLFITPGWYAKIALPAACAFVAAVGAWQELRTGKACACLGDMSSRYRHLIAPLRYLTVGIAVPVMAACLMLKNTPPASLSAAGAAAGIGVFLCLLYRNAWTLPPLMQTPPAPQFDGWKQMALRIGAAGPEAGLQAYAMRHGGITLIFTNEGCKPCQLLQARIDVLNTAFNLTSRVLFSAPEGQLHGGMLDTHDRNTLLSRFSLRGTPSALHLPVDGTPEALIGETAILSKLLDMANAGRCVKDAACA